MFSFNSGVSGLTEFQKQIDVIGNNIANVNTTGFRSSRVEFSDAFSNTLRSAATSSAGTSTPGMQIGTGVKAGAISTNFSTYGSPDTTGFKTDLAIQGDGFFIVRDPATDTLYATRAGHFAVKNGYLVTSDTGLRVQGFSDDGLTTRGDIRIDNTKDGTTPLAFTDAAATTPATLNDYSIGKDGRITVTLNGVSTEYTRGQVLLQRFSNPQALVKEGSSLYSGIAEAGALGGTSPVSQAPDTNGLGTIAAGARAGSNVDLTREMTNMITAQRAFQATSKIVTTSDEMLQEVVNLKR